MEIGCQAVRKWKKGGEPLLYTKRTRGPVGPSTNPDALENKYFASAGTRTTTPPYRTYCDIPTPGHELPDLKPTRLHTQLSWPENNSNNWTSTYNHGLPFSSLLSSATEQSSMFILPLKCQLNDITLVYKF